MKDGALKSCVAIAGIVSMYGIYAWSNPGTDGAIFATILAAVVGLGTYTITKQVAK